MAKTMTHRERQATRTALATTVVILALFVVIHSGIWARL